MFLFMCTVAFVAFIAAFMKHSHQSPRNHEPWSRGGAIKQAVSLTPQSSAQDLRVKALFVFADLWRVAVRPDVSGVHVDHGDFACLAEPSLLLLLPLPQQLICKQSCSRRDKEKLN